jgi:hypothetical protein
MKIAPLSAAAAASLALTFTLPARSATGMAAMQYKVGTWSCTGGTIGKQPFHFTVTYTRNGDFLQIWFRWPKGSVETGSLTYDSKKHRYVRADVVSDGSWFVAYATVNGNTETSVDQANNEGTLGRLVTVRNSNTTVTSTGYDAVSGGKAFIRATCHKS